MECGQGIDIKDMFGQRPIRFVSQCGGRFLMISHTITDHRNGYMLADWRGVARELVALSVPRSMANDRGMRAESLSAGFFHDLPLTYPLSIKGLADVLGQDAEDVRGLLADLAVQAE